MRQVAGDTRALVESSLVSAQIPGRTELLGKVAQSQEMPSIDDLEQLWFVLQQEMTESGKVVRFPATVIAVGGGQSQQSVVRIGPFNAVSNGRYLQYLPESGKLAELGRQPSGRHLATVRDLERARSGLVGVSIDPSRGSILSLLIQTPDMEERIHQGGLVGYVIIVLGLMGLLLAAYRILYLAWVGRKIRRRCAQPTAQANNPLGRVLEVYERNRTVDVETLELKLDEAILKETPPLERGNAMIKVLSVVSPLLGLLGTVTGMIQTFQAITLFGTGDPKLMAGGISEALVTTMLGLVVAIPLVLLHTMVTGQSRGADPDSRGAERRHRRPARRGAGWSRRARSVQPLFDTVLPAATSSRRAATSWWRFSSSPSSCGPSSSSASGTCAAATGTQCGEVIDEWHARRDRSSWYAHQIRRGMVSRVSMDLNRTIPLIKTLVALCPLLGLLGTVTGMIEVFDVMAMAGSGNPRAMASGVSRAIIPTMAGMVAALSGLRLQRAAREAELRARPNGRRSARARGLRTTGGSHAPQATRSEDETEINLTPMLDVMFIMLIFFIVTASFVKEAGIDVNRPAAATAERKEHGNILVAITDDGQIWIDKRPVDVRAVRANIERLHAENPQGSRGHSGGPRTRRTACWCR